MKLALCPECKSENLIENKNKGELVCRQCGLIIEDEQIEDGKEWRNFDSEDSDDFRRTGAPLTNTKYDKGLLTQIGQKSDFYNMKSKDRYKYYKMKSWQGRVANSIERNLKMALAELRRICSSLKIPKIVEEDAALLYFDSVKARLIRGRSIELVVISCIYASCKRHEIPRTLEEMQDVSGIKKREIARTYRFVTRKLNITIAPPNPSDYISRFISILKLSAETESTSIIILNDLMTKGISSGKDPAGIAAASIYISSLLHGSKRTQKEIADITGVTEVTVRNRYKEILESLVIEKIKGALE